MAKGQYEIPFDQSGNQLHYPDAGWLPNGGGEAPIDWRPNTAFTDTLVYEGYRRGRSAAYFEFHRVSDKTKACMFLTDFDDVARLMVQGRLTSRWTFVKRGQNYGIKLVTE